MARVTIAISLVSTAALAQPSPDVDVLTHRYDNARSGANLRESALKVSNVNRKRFGKLAFRIVDGNIYAQPLIVTRAEVVNRAQPPQTVQRDLAIVATQHNSVFAFDANDTSPDPDGQESNKWLWRTDQSVLGAAVPSTEISTRIGKGDSGCTDLTTEVGITATPAIALDTATPPKRGVLAAPGDQNPVRSANSVCGVWRPLRPAPEFQESYHGWVLAYDVTDPKVPQRVDLLCTTPNATGLDLIDSGGGIWMSGHGIAEAGGAVYLSVGDGS